MSLQARGLVKLRWWGGDAHDGVVLVVVTGGHEGLTAGEELDGPGEGGCAEEGTGKVSEGVEKEMVDHLGELSGEEGGEGGGEEDNGFEKGEEGGDCKH